MRKLRLDIQDLKVESFSSADPVPEMGTVHGQVGVWQPPIVNSVDACETVGTCPGPTNCCPPTWKQTCAYSCHPTGECGASCNTWFWCGTCVSCVASCNEGDASCTYQCGTCPF